MHTLPQNLAKGPRLFLLLLLISLPAVGTVLFTPALPAIAQFFGVGTAAAQLTMTTYLIGFALGQLPYGPLSNRFGRKPPFRVGLILAAIGSLLCVLAGIVHLFPLLVIARFIMALGASAGLKIVFTMIGDAYTPPHSTKVFSYAILAYAIMPGVAISLGGFLTQNFGWEGCFYFLSAYSLLLLILLSFLPETHRPEHVQKLSLENIVQGYLAKFKNHKLVTCAFILGLRTSFIYIFAAKAPFIAIHEIGLSPEQFGLLSLIPPLGMILGTVLAVQLAGRLRELIIILIGTSIAVIGTAGILLPFVFGNVNAWSLFIPMFTIDIGLSLIYANASSVALSHAKNISNGSAVMNFINIGFSVVMVLLIQAISPDDPLVLPILFGIMLMGIVCFWALLNKLCKN